MLIPFRRHWNVNGPLPSTPTANVAVLPSFTSSEAGCVTMVGATATGAPGYTLSTAALLLASPAALVTVTVKLPEFMMLTPLRRSTGLFSPASALPLRNH